MSVIKLIKILKKKYSFYKYIRVHSFLNENLEDEYNFYLFSKKSMDLYINNEKIIKKEFVLNTLKYPHHTDIC